MNIAKEPTPLDQSSVQSYDPKNDQVDIDLITSEPVKNEQTGRSNHWEVRTQEQSYAFLPSKEDEDQSEIENRYGKRIDLIELTDNPKDRSMFINENPEVGTNPNLNKQHGFFFTADN